MSLDAFQQILNRIKSRYPELSNRLKESEAVNIWEKVVGPQIAKHTRVLKVEDGVFHIEVDHPAWKTEVHHRKKQILEKMKETVQEVKITDLFLVEKKYSSPAPSNATRANTPRFQTTRGARPRPIQSASQTTSQTSLPAALQASPQTLKAEEACGESQSESLEKSRNPHDSVDD